MVEYALILVLISIVVIVILLTMGGQIKNVFSNVVTASAPNALGLPDGEHGPASGWYGAVRNDSSFDYTMKVIVICGKSGL